MKFMNHVLSIGVVLIAFGFYQAASPSLNAQVIYKGTAEKPTGGASGGSSSSGSDGLIIAAGVVVAAVVGYALYKKFSKSEEDSSSNLQSTYNKLMLQQTNSFLQEAEVLKERIPIDLYFGIRNPNAALPDRSYTFGISYRF